MMLNTIILAAGQGTRMHSKRAKVLQTIGGKAMLSHVVSTSSSLHDNQIIIVYGHDGDNVKRSTQGDNISWVLQHQQLGTAHAVEQGLTKINDDATILVLYGDIPLIRVDTLRKLIKRSQNGLAILTTILDIPDGYGRIVRDVAGRIKEIVEHKDANKEQLKLTEVNTGILSVKANLLRAWISRVDNNNVQKEYYLTDIIALATADKVAVEAIICNDNSEVMGINTRYQQAQAERVYQLRECVKQMASGVFIKNPESVSINGSLECGKDVIIEENVIFNGNVTIGDDVSIGPFTMISESVIGNGVVIQSHSVIDRAAIGDNCKIGPFARLRPETNLSNNVHVGNFVEIKKSNIGSASKISHLTYIGDTDMGSGVNVGAGTITCNYDGANKFQTIIGDNVFIGSDSQLIAPLKIGNGVTIAAGTTVTKDVEDNVLVISRTEQKIVSSWNRPKK